MQKERQNSGDSPLVGNGKGIQMLRFTGQSTERNLMQKVGQIRCAADYPIQEKQHFRVAFFLLSQQPQDLRPSHILYLPGSGHNDTLCFKPTEEYNCKFGEKERVNPEVLLVAADGEEASRRRG